MRKASMRIDQTARADIVVLSSADTTLSLLASVFPRLEAGFPERAARELIVLAATGIGRFLRRRRAAHARVVIVDHLGGEAYWPYGIEQVVALAKRKQQTLAMFSGDLQEDPNLLAQQHGRRRRCAMQLWRYLREGGAQNAEAFLRCIASSRVRLGTRSAAPPRALPAVALYHPERDTPTIDDWQARWQPKARRSPRSCSIARICSRATRRCSMR